MNDVEIVQILEPSKKLKDDLAYELYFESILLLLQHLQKIILNILKHKVNNAFLPKCLFQLDNVRMVGHFQYLNFSHSGLLGVFLFVTILESLNSNKVIGLYVTTFEYNSICTFANC